MEQKRNQFTIVYWGIVIALVMLVASVVAYANAYFTAKTDKKGNLNFHNIELELDTEGVDSFSVNLTEIVPGDTLELTDVSVKNVGTAELYAIINLNIYITRPGYTDYNVDYWKDLEGNDINVSDLDSNTVGATKVALNGSKALNLSHPFAGAIFDNSFKNATAKITLNAYGIQTTHLEPIGSISAENLIATKMLVDENYSFKAQNIVDYDQFDEVESLSCSTSSLDITYSGMYIKQYNFSVSNAREDDTIYVNVSKEDDVSYMFDDLQTFILPGNHDMGILLEEFLQYEEEALPEGSVYGALEASKTFTISDDFDGNFDVVTISSIDEIPTIEIRTSSKYGPFIENGKSVYVLDYPEVKSKKISFNTVNYTCEVGEGSGEYIDIFNYRVSNPAQSSVANINVNEGMLAFALPGNYTTEEAIAMLMNLDNSMPAGLVIMGDGNSVGVLTGAIAIPEGDDFRFAVGVMRIQDYTPDKYTVEITCDKLKSAIDYEELKAEEPLIISTPTHSMVCSLVSEITAKAFNFTIENVTEDRTVMVGVMGYISMATEKHTTLEELTTIDANLTDYVFADNPVESYRVGLNQSSGIVFSFNLKKGEDFTFSILDWNTIDNATTMIAVYLTPTDDLPYVNYDIAYIPLEDGSGYTTMPQTVIGLKNIIIEDYINGLPVKEIASGTLVSQTKSLTSITVPSTVETIEANVFQGLKNLTELNLQAKSGYMWVEVDSSGNVLTELDSLTQPELISKLTSASSHRELKQVPAVIRYTLSSDGTYYILSYVPNNVINLEIPAEYEGKPVKEIKASAASGKTNLKSVSIGANVTTIGSSAFYGCSSLTSIEIPSSVTTIGGSAFSGCSGLTSITIPNSVTTIVNAAFRGCSGLTSITIPNSVTTMGTDAFMGCSGLTSVIFGENSQLTTIERWAFADCSSLTNIEIPSSVTTIRYLAFGRCSSLTSIEIPSSVTTIEEQAFNGCSNVTELILHTKDGYEWVKRNSSYLKRLHNLTSQQLINELLPSWYYTVEQVGAPIYELSSDKTYYTLVVVPSETTNFSIPAEYEGKPVKAIGPSAFDGCASLASIEIPNSVTTIGNYAFYGCSSLTTFALQEAKSGYVWAEVNYNGKVIAELNTLTNEELLTKIKSTYNGFKQVVNTPTYTLSNDKTYYSLTYVPKSLTNFSIASEYEGKPVKAIGGYAFSGCTSLTSIEIPNSVTTIGENAFYGCTSLASIEIPNSVTTMSMGAFVGCSGLTSVTFEENSQLTTIEDSAFADCSSLASIEIPNSVTTIEDYAFSGCSSLASIEIPSSVTTIGSSAFSGCSSLASIKIPSSVTTISSGAFGGCSGLTSVTFEENSQLTTIGSSAFSGCSSLASIEIPNTVTTIERFAFSGCSNLTSVTFEENSQLTTIEYSAFSKCSSLTDIIIPSSVTTMGISSNLLNDAVFYHCSSLASVTFEDNSQLTTIFEDMFYGCTNLTSVIFGENSQLTTIGASAFSGKSLTSIEIPSSVREIDSFAFDGCSDLTRITFGENSQLTTIGEYAFRYCASLTSIEIPSGVTSIGAHAFYNCSSLTSITFGENSQLTTIGTSAFGSCSSLTSITFGENSQLTTIGTTAFGSCSGLTSIQIPNSVTTISGNVFRGCLALTSLTVEQGNSVYHSEGNCIIETATNTLVVGCKESVIPNYVTTIGAAAFSGSTGLTSIEIPSSVTEIGENAFYGCSGLTILTLPEKANHTWLVYVNSAWVDCVTLTDDQIFGHLKSGKQFRQVQEGKVNYVLSNDGTYYILAYVPNDVTNLTILSEYEGKPVKEIKKLAASGKTTLTSVSIPNSVTMIGENAFYGCSNLTSVTLGENSQLTTIGKNAFYGCSSLTSIEIPNSVTMIGDNAFRSCSNLTSATFEENSQLTTIGEYAFYGCSSLTSIEIQSSVTAIGYQAFRGCSSLTKLTLQAKENYKWQIVISNYEDCSNYTPEQIVQYAKDGKWFRQIAI